MEKFELEKALADEIRERVFGEGFMKLVQSVRRGGESFRISLRPVEIGGERRFQAEMVDEGQTQVKNFNAKQAADGLDEIIAQKGARELHLITAKGDMHIRVTKKGHVLVSRSSEMNRQVVVQGHDRVKKTPLNSFDSAALLRTIGIADGEGNIRASMRGKYDQVNEFLRVVGSLQLPSAVDSRQSVVGSGNEGEKATNYKLPTTNCFTVVDCGCGKAYLTLALYFYLTHVMGVPNVKVYGVDRREDVIEAARKMAKALDVADRVIFVQSDLADFNPTDAAPNSQLSTPNSQLPPKVDMVVSLHACDTATDEALAKAVEWRAKYILSAPCCQHELQKGIAEMSGRATGPAVVFGGLLRQSILRERLCDILTDAFRALILRILGFKVQVIEFVSSEATMRNIMLKCEYCIKPGQSGPVGEYLALRNYWGVKPWLESRLERLLEKHLVKFQ